DAVRMASSMAAMTTSGLMFLSRLICSICCRSWLGMIRLPGELGFQPGGGHLAQRDASQSAFLGLDLHADGALLHGQEAPSPLPPRRDRLVAGDLGGLADEAAE